MSMTSPDALIEDLQRLNDIAETLNQAEDIHSALNSALTRLVEMMGLDTGWVFLKDPSETDLRWGPGFTLAAHYNLPPALALGQEDVWNASCACQTLCMQEKLCETYNEVRCSRLASSRGDRRGLTVHASAPLRSGNRTVGILNVAGKDWSSFDPRSLALLTNVGIQMGIALERASLYQMLRERRIEEQAALLDFSNRLLAYTKLEDLMDFLVCEVRRLLKTDACALVLPSDDPETLLFRAACGWNQNPVEAKRTVPADPSSGPGWVMQNQRPLLVEDLQGRNPTQWAPDWLRTEDFRGHAVVPLQAEGRSIGALVINDRQSHLLSDDDLRFLRVMANQGAIAIENARLQMEEITRHRLEEELLVGKQIQLSLLPESCPTLPGWEIAAIYQAARQVGGDFYDCFELPDGTTRLGIVIADVSDKGVPAALFMAMARTMIRTTALSGLSPAQALSKANRLILKDSRSDLFLSAFYAILDPDSGHLTYANAGHNHPFLWQSAAEELIELRAKGIILGAFEEVTLHEEEVVIQPGDFLLLYTDGVTDASNDHDELFGAQRLRDILAAQGGKRSEEIAQAILAAVNEFIAGGPQADDLTLLIIRRLCVT
jgi:serine phosphatase RsbU (regulator of sigma subunit)